MIAKGKAVSHEAAMMEYALGKKDAEYVTSHGLASDPVLMVELSAQEILDEFRQHRLQHLRHSRGRRLEDTILRFELCPTAEETKGWTREDWQKLINEFIRTLDSLDYVKTKSGKMKVPKTNLGNTQWVAFLHHDGANGCDHIHLLGNRIDLEGNTISDSYLLPKAELAANIINHRRGWKQSFEIGREHREELRAMCYDILSQMSRWDWDDYFRRINARGFEHFCRPCSDGKVRGYSIFYGNASIPASEIDRGLTWGKIEDTWRRLHPVEVQQRPTDGETVGQQKPQKPSEHGCVWYRLPMQDNKFVPGGCKSLSVSRHVADIFRNEISLPDIEDYVDEGKVTFPELEDVVKVAVTLFFGYVNAATAMSESYGGGGGNTSGWGRHKDDEDEWARRCARMASLLCTPAHRPKIRRGGHHR